jgi:ubiquitin-activating enzyme E1
MYEKSIPSCTVKNFPNAIEHTIQWAREKYQVLAHSLELIELLSRSLELFDKIGRRKVQVDIGRRVDKELVFEECIEWARLKFEDDYVNEIKQLLYNLPKDQVRVEWYQVGLG